MIWDKDERDDGRWRFKPVLPLNTRLSLPSNDYLRRQEEQERARWAQERRWRERTDDAFFMQY